MSLRVANLSGGYYQQEIISDLNFTLKPGEIVCMAGLNGAGKSTTIRHIMGLMKPYKGTISIDDQTIFDDRNQYQKKIAYIPENPLIYEELTLKEHIELTGMTYEINQEEVMERAQPLLKLFRLERQLDWYPVDFSKGMKQKVMIVCAFITQAKLMVIDEPFIGLDPLAMKDFVNLMKSAKANGTAILMSTHVLSSIKTLCDRMIIIDGGKLVAQGSLSEIAAQFETDVDHLDALFDKIVTSERDKAESRVDRS